MIYFTFICIILKELFWSIDIFKHHYQIEKCHGIYIFLLIQAYFNLVLVNMVFVCFSFNNHLNPYNNQFV